MIPRKAAAGIVCGRCGTVAFGGEVYVGGRRGLECAACAGDDLAWEANAPGGLGTDVLFKRGIIETQVAETPGLLSRSGNGE